MDDLAHRLQTEEPSRELDLAFHKFITDDDWWEVFTSPSGEEWIESGKGMGGGKRSQHLPHYFTLGARIDRDELSEEPPFGIPAELLAAVPGGWLWNCCADNPSTGYGDADIRHPKLPVYRARAKTPAMALGAAIVLAIEAMKEG